MRAICVRPKSDTYADVFSRFIFIKFTAKKKLCILLLNSRKQIILSDFVSFDVAFLNFSPEKKTHIRTDENHYAYKMTFPDNNKDLVQWCWRKMFTYDARKQPPFTQ